MTPQAQKPNVTAYLNNTLGRAMAQAVSRRPLTAKARVRSWVGPCGICGGQSGTGTGFSPSTSVFPCQFHSTGAPLLGKMKTDHLSLHLHHKGCTIRFKGCGASVASAAGTFTKKLTVKINTILLLERACNVYYIQNIFVAQQPLGGLGLLTIEDSRSHSDTPHSVGLLWTSDQPVAETST
jgi:hypothetical protein